MKNKAVPLFQASKYVVPGSISETQVNRAKQYFDLLDPTSTGAIKPKQIKDILLLLGEQSTQHPLYQLLCDFEADGKGSIGFEDFLHLMSRRVIESDPKHHIRKVFSLYDEDKTGYISIQNLRKVADDLNENITEDQLQRMIKIADRDKDGKVSTEEFYELISRKYRLK